MILKKISQKELDLLLSENEVDLSDKDISGLIIKNAAVKKIVFKNTKTNNFKICASTIDEFIADTISFNKCLFKDVQIRGGSFKSAAFLECVFDACRILSVDGMSFENVRFQNGYFARTFFDRLNLNKAIFEHTKFNSLCLVNCRLDQTLFHNVEFIDDTIKHASLTLIGLDVEFIVDSRSDKKVIDRIKLYYGVDVEDDMIGYVGADEYQPKYSGVPIRHVLTLKVPKGSKIKSLDGHTFCTNIKNIVAIDGDENSKVECVPLFYYESVDAEREYYEAHPEAWQKDDMPYKIGRIIASKDNLWCKFFKTVEAAKTEYYFKKKNQ